MSTPNNNTELSALLGSGPICGALSVIVPTGLLIYMVVSVAGSAVPIVAVVAFALFLRAAVAARTDAVSIAIAVTGLTLVVADAGFLIMALAGAILFLTFVLHDLSKSLRRAPTISPVFGRGLALSTGAVIVVGWLSAGIAYLAANATVWPKVVVPVAVLVIGLFVFVTLQQVTLRSEDYERDQRSGFAR